MRKSHRYARTSALPAIAAALALSSTPVFAQETPSASTPPVASDPAPTVANDPAPAVDSTPVATDPVASETTTTTKKTVTKRAIATAKPAPKVATRTVTQKVTRTAHAAVPAAAAAPVAPPASAPTPAKPAPVVDLSAKPANPAPAPAPKAEPANNSNETAMELGGGALALIAIGAGAYALTRRRRRDDEIAEEVYEPEATAIVEPEQEAAPRHDPVLREEPAIIAPHLSAFAWDKQASPAPAAQATDDDGSDRRPGESWIDRAYRGPSPANPSVSLRARLKRAAFFDKRERDVAAGKAEPVETDAGLPEAMVEEQERELA